MALNMASAKIVFPASDDREPLHHTPISGRVRRLPNQLFQFEMVKKIPLHPYPCSSFYI